MLGLVKMRELSIDDQFSLRGPVLQKAIDVSGHLVLILLCNDCNAGLIVN